MEKYSSYSTDKTKVVITFIVTTAVLVLHEAFHVGWFSTRHYFFPLYVLFIAHFLNFWAFLVMLTSNPGIIQKIKKKCQNDVTYLQVPKNQLTNIVPITSTLGKLKLCSTCNIYRPPRTHHCSLCGVCIERMDHHCPWLGVCIGKYNYKFFYTFLLTLIIAIIVTVVMCIQIMAQQARVFPLAIILVLVCVPAFIFVGSMLGFHTFISCINITTKQFLDDFWIQVAGNPNRKPFFVKNCLKIFFVKSERQIKYKYVQYFVKSQGQSSSQHKASSSQNNNPNNISRASESQKPSNSNSDENNISKEKSSASERKQKAQKTKTQEKQNSFEKKNEVSSSVKKSTKQESKLQNNNYVSSSSNLKKTTSPSKGIKSVLAESSNSKKVVFNNQSETINGPVSESISKIQKFGQENNRIQPNQENIRNTNDRFKAVNVLQERVEQKQE